MKKRMFALFLSLVLVFSVYSSVGLSVYSAESDDSIELPGVSLGGIQSGVTGSCTWTLAGTKLTITGTGAMANYTPSSTLPWGTTVTTVVVKNGVTNVGDYALNGCKSLTAISLSASVNQVSVTAFEGCSSIKTILVPSGNATYASVQNCLVKKQGQLLVLGSCGGAIPQDGSVTTIGDGAFSNYKNLSAVTIGKAVTQIQSGAFEGCNSISDVWYTGTQAEFKAMNIGDNNGSLLSATWHFNICADDAHTYTVDCDPSCGNCEFLREPLVAHSFDNACDADCNACGTPCTPADHEFDNVCDPDCNECDLIRPVLHVYDNGCDEDCNECGVTREVAHTYDNDCDASCNVCSSIRTPADHIYDNEQDADCNACGQTRPVQTILLGDLNNDGQVNPMDRVILIRHLAEWEGYEADTFNYAAADLNSDGQVNPMDRVILIRHLAEWEGYETLPKLD